MGRETRLWRYCDRQGDKFWRYHIWSVPGWTEENLEKMFGIYNSFSIIDTEL
jgi:hypothetical protein